MTRDERRMDLWCKVVIASAGNSAVQWFDVTDAAKEALRKFDEEFPAQVEKPYRARW